MDDFSKRILCTDGTCVGIINERGYCNVCGKPLKGENEKRETGQRAQERREQETETEKEGEKEPSFEERIPCNDGSCIGIINENGFCNICGKTLKSGRESKEKDYRQRRREKRNARGQERGEWERTEQETRKQNRNDERTGMFNIKGWLGEKETQFFLWARLDKETYKRFHNIILETKKGTTQIDHVILSRYGIFVIETKNYSGWIFGDKDQRSWTQVLFSKKSRFQNPLHQNYKHTRALAECLNVDHNKIHSVVFFIGDDVELKGNIPPNVLSSGLSSYIKKFNQIIFSDAEFFQLEKHLKQFKKDNMISTEQHVGNLRERYLSDARCPKCGGELVRRIAKSGSFEGKEFFGCSNFPACKYIKIDR